MPPTVQLLTGDALVLLQTLAPDSVHCCVTSPPYMGLRAYLPAGHPDKGREIGGETNLTAYVENLVAVFREVRRVLRPDGVLWLNLGDSYARDAKKGQHKPGDPGKQAYLYERGGGRASATVDLSASGLKPKDLCGVPWRVALALQADGWYLRSEVIWAKPNAMPSPVKDRPTVAHETIFMLTKSPQYWYDAAAIAEPAKRAGDTQTFGSRKGRAYQPQPGDPNYRGGSHQWGRTVTVGKTRNRRSVWSVPIRPYRGAHFATFPPDLIRPMILAGCPASGLVLDIFGGAGTTALVAQQLGRSAISMELSPAYTALASARLSP